MQRCRFLCHFISRRANIMSVGRVDIQTDQKKRFCIESTVPSNCNDHLLQRQNAFDSRRPMSLRRASLSKSASRTACVFSPISSSCTLQDLESACTPYTAVDGCVCSRAHLFPAIAAGGVFYPIQKMVDTCVNARFEAGTLLGLVVRVAARCDADDHVFFCFPGSDAVFRGICQHQRTAGVTYQIITQIHSFSGR